MAPSPCTQGEGWGEGSAGSAAVARRRWAILIQRVYEVDPLICPKCGGTMKILSFIEARQADIIEKNLRHCGLWDDISTRGPPLKPPAAPPSSADPSPGFTSEPDPDFLEHSRREKMGEMGQLDLYYEP